jgi:hypothetical protein
LCIIHISIPFMFHCIPLCVSVLFDCLINLIQHWITTAAAAAAAEEVFQESVISLSLSLSLSLFHNLEASQVMIYLTVVSVSQIV